MSRVRNFWIRHRGAFAIFAVALALRLVHVWQLRSSPFFDVLMGDARGYDEWARRIASGEWIGHDVFYQAPLYPYVLGVIYVVAGRHLVLVRAIQAVVGSGSCVLIGLATARLFGRRAGLVAGLMLAVYAPSIFFDGLIQKSVLDEFFVCLALLLIATLVSSRLSSDAMPSGAKSSLVPAVKTAPSPPQPGASSRPALARTWLFLGLTMGGLALTRENALVFIVVITTWALVKVGLRPAATFIAGLALALTPVAVRNYAVGGGFYITTSQFGPNLYIGNHPGADGTYESLRFGRGAPEYERLDATELAEHALGRRLTPAEVSSYWSDQAIGYMTSQPGAWLRLMWRKTRLLANATEMLDTESQESYADWSLPLRLGAPFGHFGIVVPLALFGVIVTWASRSTLGVLYAMTIAYGASVVVFYVFARYRYPLVPFLVIFAAVGLLALPDAIRSRSVPGGAWTAVAVLGVAIFANWPMLNGATMRAITESNLGVALQDQQRTADSIAHYQRAITLRPDYAPVYSNLASALRTSGHPDQAVATYERALALQPDFPDAHYNLANALFDEGRMDAAIEHFQIARRSLPGSADIETNLGVALASRGQFDAAIDAFRSALTADPNAEKAHRNLGDLLASTGRPDEAIEHLRRAIQLAPEDESAHYDLGSLLLEHERWDEAVTEFRAALRLSPNAVEVHNNLGIALGSQGKLDEAIDQFRQALAIKPVDDDARKNLAMALRAKRAAR